MGLLGLVSVGIGHDNLVDVGAVEVGERSARGQDTLELGDGVGVGPVGVGELDSELDIEMAVIVVAVGGHTFVGDDLDEVRLDGLTGEHGDEQDAVVEVGYGELATGKGGQKIDLGLVDQVVALALEALVGLLVDRDDYITRNDARSLVAFAGKRDPLAVPHALVDVDLEDLALGDDLLAHAVLAAVLVVDDLALAAAVRAGLLDLLNHGAHLAHDDTHALATAGTAGVDGALLATTALALGAGDVLLQRELGRLAAVEVLERDLELVHHVLAATGAGGTATASTSTAEQTAAKQLREQVLGIHAATHTALSVQTLLTKLIVHLSLLRIRQNLIRMRNLLELVASLRVLFVFQGQGQS